MQLSRSFQQRSLLRTALVTACLLGLAGAANAQQVTPRALEVTSDPTATVTGQKPTITTANITANASGAAGEVLVGDTLTAVFNANDVDGDQIDDTATQGTLQWLSDGQPVGTQGATTYVVQASDVGKTITFTVQPSTDQAETDPHMGDVFNSEVVAGGPGGGGDIVVTPEGDILSVTVTGNAVVNSQLTANAVCVSTCGTMQYQWMIEDAVGSGAYMPIAGATESTYTVKREDQKRSIRVIVKK